MHFKLNGAISSDAQPLGSPKKNLRSASFPDGFEASLSFSYSNITCGFMISLF